MTYTRVIPRDLFNEANLLKCYGQLWLKLENRFGGLIRMDDVISGERFEIVQRPEDGWTYIENLTPMIRGEAYRLVRPLNSREPWPLYAEKIGDPDFEGVAVFDDNGNLSDDFQRLLSGSPF